MSDTGRKPTSPWDALPKMRTPSGRYVYDPSQLPANTVDTAELRRMLEEARALEETDARDAVPEPEVAQAASDGAIVVAGEEAVRAHTEALIEPRATPHVPNAPVRVADAVDPRRQPTKRLLRGGALPSPTTSSPPPVSAENVAPTTDESRRPGSANKRAVRWALGVIAACVVAIVWFVAGRRGSDGAPQNVASGVASETTSGPRAPAVASGAGSRSGDPDVEAIAPSATVTENATSAAGATGNAPDAPSATSDAPAPRAPPSSAPGATRRAPPGGDDPYGDAGAPSKILPSPSSTPSTSPTTPAPKPAPTLWFGDQ